LAQQGDLAAFNSLIERQSAALYRVVRRMCSDRAEAEALTQEAFLRAWEHLDRWKSDQPFWPWLVRIAVNAARDALKKSRPLDFADLPVDPAESLTTADPGPEAILEQADLMGKLAAAVECLPGPYKLAITLRYQAELSYEDMAAALNLPVNTVRTHLRRAKQQLRDLLETDDDRPPRHSLASPP
jgi:RNA polymerase sigma-70 factor (ECF subfamily)